ncbi:serine/threonine-protein kinase [Marinicella litoralis]|uniref:Serine/threonine-protein kinase n=1 Tax=Marinicella litoralis TaxID=644220 RepID=A0A4R6XQ83_9GAMM|nr:serine/threonine-protein kinase [Marinicella litoralis]TDR20350.1 serine/threonine-protein kinase [Marinicella litoralis]
MPEDQQNPLTRGQQIRQLFDQCLDLTLSEQIDLIQHSAASPEVKKHVSQLLQFSEAEIELTQAVVNRVQLSLDIKPIVPQMKIGAYELIKPLGEGGQGEVWLACRSGGDFHHQVAIKFLKPVHSQIELARFQSERELLASLKHPNIAQLLDGGELDDNRPYMVLELVEGLPLLDYCKQNQFTLKDYLKCFLQICDAISYAHAHSVIHRDIKPSNIYVTHDGTVKLLDFGIAKFMDKDEVKTQTLPMMTLAYSSPEQVTGSPVSTTTDVYTLGLLLYEMLTGQRAQAVKSDVPAELMHEITQLTPILPSQLIQTIDFKRSYGRSQLKGDLDNLILMAVRKEPARRYQSVEAISQDIKNFLNGMPLLAAGDSHWYHAKKFVTRNPLASTLSTVLVLFMVALPLVLINNQKHLKVERDKALLAQEVAQEQSTIANRTTDFLVNILESASPLANKGEAIDLDDVLASAERQLAVGLDEQPKIKATLLSKLAGIQHQLGHHDQAIKYYLSVLELHQAEGNLSGQAYAYGQLGIMAYFADDETAAIEYQKKAMALVDDVADPKDLAWLHIRIATIDGFFRKDELVIDRLQQTLESLLAQGIEDQALLGRIYNEMSNVTPDKELALQYISLAAEYAEALNGRMHPLFQVRQQNKALKLKELERYAEAEAIFIENRENARKLYTEEHPNYSSVTAELGALYHDQGKYQEVKAIYAEAIDISQRVSGKKSLNYVLQINNMAYLYEDMGQFELAEPLYRESIELRQKYHSGSPYRIASSRSNLARLLSKMGRHQESQKILDEIIPIYVAYQKSNLQNDITAIANFIGQNPSTATCQSAWQKINTLLPALEQLSDKSWRRMFNELRLGELAYECGRQELAESLLSAAAKKSMQIYATGSDGQKMIQFKVNSLLD